MYTNVQKTDKKFDVVPTYGVGMPKKRISSK